MSEINKPEQIIVDKLTLKQVPAQQKLIPYKACIKF